MPCVDDFQWDKFLVTPRGVDQTITKLFRDAVGPAQVDIALQAMSALDARREERPRKW